MIDSLVHYSGLTAEIYAYPSLSAAEVTLGPIPEFEGELRSHLADKTPTSHESEAVSLLNASQYNYFHMMAQSLPHLCVMDDALPREVPLVLGAHHSGGHSFVTDALQLLYPHRRFVLLNVGEAITVEELTSIPPLTTNILLPDGLKLLRTRILRALDPEIDPVEAVYLRRGDGERDRRRTLNDAEIVEALRYRWPGIRVITPGRLSFREQIQAVRGAKFVIGAHGAQLTNLLWADQDATVIEIAPRNLNVASVFRGLANATDVTYHCAQSFGSSGHDWAFADQVVDINSLNAIVRMC
jgi:capsular polysaccharide biosynthesis protein